MHPQQLFLSLYHVGSDGQIDGAHCSYVYLINISHRLFV